MKALRVVQMSLLLFVTVVGCRIDEAIIGVTPGSQGIKFEFRYIVQADQPVKVYGLLVEESKSGAIVWEIEVIAPEEADETDAPTWKDRLMIQGRDIRRKSYGTPIALTALSYGEVPTGFKQVTPASQEEIQLRHDLRYRVVTLTERGSGMTEFTLKGECQKIPVTTFSKDLPEFKESKDC